MKKFPTLEVSRNYQTEEITLVPVNEFLLSEDRELYFRSSEMYKTTTNLEKLKDSAKELFGEEEEQVSFSWPGTGGSELLIPVLSIGENNLILLDLLDDDLIDGLEKESQFLPEEYRNSEGHVSITGYSLEDLDKDSLTGEPLKVFTKVCIHLEKYECLYAC